MGSNRSGSFPLVLMKCASLGGAGWCFSWTQIPFSLASSFFWSFSFTRFRKLSRLLECLICLIRTLILLARILPLFVYSDASSMLGNIVESPSFAMATFVGHSFLNSTHALDIYNITLLVDLHRCGQRNNSMFLKGLENMQRVPLLFSFVLVILANYWKMVVPADRLPCCF